MKPTIQPTPVPPVSMLQRKRTLKNAAAANIETGGTGVVRKVSSFRPPTVPHRLSFPQPDVLLLSLLLRLLLWLLLRRLLFLWLWLMLLLWL